LRDDESDEILARERVVRIAFQDGQSQYLIPLGYVWLQSALYGVTKEGRKTRLAKVNPNVAFQVDTSHWTGLWEWQGVTGEGTFGIVGGEEERQQVLSALEPLIAEAPAWWLREQEPRLASGTFLVWRLNPTRVSGRGYARPEQVSG
jgi:nitroimidazol reductase NimA-like FMN-containing flavoprotein (pyridoxamine 5'-phosphate oxidase superfamily)